MLNEYDDESSARKVIKQAIPEVRNIFVFRKPNGIRRILNKLLYLFRGLHPSLSLCVNGKLKTWIKKIDKNHAYDLIHFDMFYMSIYKKYIVNSKTLLVPSDSYSLAKLSAMQNTKLLHKKFIYFVESLLLSRTESKYYKNMDLIVSVSPVDAGYLENEHGLKNVTYTGIALSNDLKNKEISHFSSASPENNKGVLCTGGFSNEHVTNGLLLFLEELDLELKKSRQSIDLTVLAKSPYKSLQQYISNHQQINYIDFVKDYYSFLDADWVYVYAQQCGTGLQTKVQQALASGLPVVGFPVAFSGMPELVHGVHCYICDSYNDMIQYTLELASDYEKRLEMGRAAREIICINYSEEKIGGAYLNFYKSLY
jgi:glycosyltransferase involved in cell wall biosynthesis